jgi:hypothetical protein
MIGSSPIMTTEATDSDDHRNHLRHENHVMLRP